MESNVVSTSSKSQTSLGLEERRSRDLLSSAPIDQETIDSKSFIFDIFVLI